MSFAAVSGLSLAAAGTAAPGLDLDRADGIRLVAILLGSVVAVVIGALGFIPGVRRWLSRFLPINPDSFVHMVAVVAVVALMLLSFIPLIVLGAPPILALIDSAGGAADLTGGQDDAAQLRSTVYGLIWTVPGTIVAVGYAIRRNLSGALHRLGLVRPTIQQIVIGIVAAVGLVLLVQVLGMGIQALWQAMGWPETDGEAFGELLKFAFSPLGAVVIGITAGLGEELAVRGVLQPRLGILLSNLFFTGLHAFQYNWDSLLIVFTVGMVLGVIRKRTNTTTSAITHGVYDFLLIMASVLSLPGFTE
jgi:membrane protease YdiL (CAAX protease family)